MIRATSLGAMIVFACVLSACGGGTSFDNSDALSSDNNTSNSPGSTPGSNGPEEDPDIPDVTDTGNSGPVVSNPVVTPPPTTTPQTPQGSNLSSAVISWSIPTTRENGDELTLTDIGGYEILYRKSDEIIFSSLTILDQSQSERLLEGLSPGQYEFFVLAFDTEGLYSDFSEPAVAEIGATSI